MATHVTLNDQRVVVAGDARDELWRLVAEFGLRRPIVFASPSVAKGPIVGRLLESIPAGIDLGLFAEVAPHAPIPSVVEACEALRAHGADGVFAVGGGSVMDTAKIAALSRSYGAAVTELMNRSTAGIRTILEEFPLEAAQSPRILNFAVPSTLAQAELTDAAGFTGDEGKAVFIHPMMRPAAVIFDPNLAATTPPRIWKSSAIKAFDSGVGSFAGLISQGGVAPRLVATGLGMLWEGIQELAQAEPTFRRTSTIQTAAWISVAPRWFGDFQYDQVIPRWPGADFRHQLGGVLGLPHGEASAAMVPTLLRFTARNEPPFAAELHRAMGVDGATAADQMVRAISALGLAPRLSALGVTADQLGPVSVAVERESGGVWNRESALEMLHEAL
jgi:maleylacetate reductase